MKKPAAFIAQLSLPLLLLFALAAPGVPQNQEPANQTQRPRKVFPKEQEPEDVLRFDTDLVSGLKGLADNSVDRIMALNILEHIDKQTLATVLEEAARVLKPSGYLVAMTPNAGSPFGSMTRYWDITHEIAFTPSAFRQIGLLCGFKRFDFRECGPRPHGVVSAIRYVLWQMIRLSIKFRLLVEMASTKGGIYTADMLTRMAKQ